MKKREELISVIVPIYKVEEYLDRCIESIVNQTYKNLEIILVDDGSPDNCLKICDIWKEKDDRIIVIHKRNGGLSDARNSGLDIASGNYISFIDSDDFVSNTFIEDLYYLLIETHSDIVQCRYSKFKYDYEIKNILNENIYIIEFNTENAIKSLLEEDILQQVVWNKLYKIELFNNLKFKVGKLNEDEFFTYKIFSKAKKIAYLNKCNYYYFNRDNSIMGKNYSIKRLDGLDARYERYIFLKNNYQSLLSLAKLNLLNSILYSYQKSFEIKDKVERKNAKVKIKTIFKLIKNDGVIITLKSIKERIWIRGMYLSLPLVSYIRKILKIGY